MKNKYIDENSYRKTNVGLRIFACLILLVGFCIGIPIVVNSIKSNNYAKSEEGIKEILAAEIELENLEALKDNEEKLNGKTDKYIDYEYQIIALEEKIEKLESNMDYAYAIPIIMISLILSLPLFFLSFQRNISAYAYTSQIPVTKEAINSITPDIANLGKEIKNTLEDEENKAE